MAPESAAMIAMTFFEIHMDTHLDPMKRVVEMLRDDPQKRSSHSLQQNVVF
jgi:hypothetical protein